MTRLREWRKAKKLTLIEVGEKLGMSHSQLGRIERAEQPYNQQMLETLAELYECEVVDLLVQEPAKIISLWSRANLSQRRQIEKIAETIVHDGTDG